MGRPGYEIRWLKIAYAIKNKKDLSERVDGELSKIGIRFGSKSDIQKGEFVVFDFRAPRFEWLMVGWSLLIFILVFAMALNTQKAVDTPYIDDAQVNQDVEALHRAGRKKDAVCVTPSPKIPSDMDGMPYPFYLLQITFAEILINRSDTHIASV